MSMQGTAAAMQHAQTARERSPGCQFSLGASRAAVSDAAQSATPQALPTGLE